MNRRNDRRARRTPDNCDTPRAILDAKIAGVRRQLRVWRLVRKIIISLGAIVLLFGAVLGLGEVNGSSMQPGMSNGDIVVYVRVVRNFAVGDIVVYDHAPGDLWVKRVVGIAGDKIDITEKGTLYVNGAPSTLEVFYDTRPADGGIAFPCIVPEGELMLMGDKRDTSIDSRSAGTVKSNEILGRVLAVWRVF